MVTYNEKYFFYALIGIVGTICLIIFTPYLTVIVLAVAFAICLHPVYSFINRRLTRQTAWLSGLLTVLLFIAVIGTPSYFIGREVFIQTQGLYQSLVENGTPGWIDSTVPILKTINISERISEVSAFLFSHVVAFSQALFNVFLSFVVMLLAGFFFLKDGKNFIDYFRDISPLSDKHNNKIFSLIADSVNGVVRGYLIVGVAQGIFMGLGLWIFGVPNAVLWGLAAAIASVVPVIGTAIVSLPAIVYLVVTGHDTAAIGMGIWAVTIVGTMDNFLSPIIVGNRLELPPVAILFGVLGGISLFGPVGIIIGPLVVSLFYALTVMYKEDFKGEVK